jgi:hypothetical protein
VRAWEAAAGGEVFTKEVLTEATAHCPPGGFSPDGRRFTRTTPGNDVVVCDAGTGQEVLSLRGHTGPVQGVAFSADGRRLASVAGREVKVWDLAAGQELHTLTGPGSASDPGLYAAAPAVALSPDGRWVAASGDGVKVWDADSGRELRTLRGHAGPVLALAFSPGGRRLASGGLDGYVRLWDVATGYDGFRFDDDRGPVISLAFSPDGRRLAAITVNSTVRGGDSIRRNYAEARVWEAEEPQPEVTAAFQEARKRARPFGTGGPAEEAALVDEIVARRRRDSEVRAALDEARSEAGRGRWAQAGAAYAGAVEGDPPAAQAAYERAAALLLAGDADGGRRARAQALERFDTTANPWAAGWAARTALLGPDPGGDRARLVRLAERALAAHPRSGFRLQTLAAAHLRAGQYEQALRRLDESDNADWFDYPLVVNWLLRAMTHHHLGQAEEARKWLDKAGAWLDQAAGPSPGEQAARLHLDLHDVMACRLLGREAQILLTGKEVP